MSKTKREKEEFIVQIQNFGGILIALTNKGNLYGCNPKNFKGWIKKKLPLANMEIYD